MNRKLLSFLFVFLFVCSSSVGLVSVDAAYLKELPVRVDLYAAFLDYYRYDNLDWWEETFHRLRQEVGVRQVGIFLYSIEPQGIYNDYTPWEKVKHKWDLSQYNKRYWKCLRKFLKVANKAGVFVEPIPFPGRYGEKPWKKNINNVWSYWDESALRFQKRYIKKICRVYGKVYKRIPWIKWSSEIAHHGDYEFGHIIGQRHEDWYKIASPWIRLKETVLDTSHSDFVSSYLTRRHWAFGKWVGKDEYYRKAWVEQHGYQVVADLRKVDAHGTCVWDVILGCSSWVKFVISSDGGTSGSIEIFPGFIYRNTSYEELYEFCLTVWLEAKAAGKRIIIAELPKEIFFLNEDEIVIEDFRLLDFERLGVMKKAWENYKGYIK